MSTYRRETSVRLNLRINVGILRARYSTVLLIRVYLLYMSFEGQAMDLTARWYQIFCSRRQRLHSIEDQKRLLEKWTAGDQSSLIDAFINERSGDFDPPTTFRHSLLRRFLHSGNINHFCPSPNNIMIDPVPPSSAVQSDVALIDDRCDPTDNKYATRVWDSLDEGGNGYLSRPPKGLECSIRTSILEHQGLYERLREEVC